MGAAWWLAALVVGAVLVAGGPMAAAQEAPELKINSKQYIVIDAETGEVFAQRRASGPENRAAMASLTKVITTVLAIEMAPPDRLITTAESDMQGPSASVMGFGPGETFPLEDLIYGMMLPSGNDAAYAVARSLGYQEGDDDATAVQRFMDHANQRLKDMGLSDTNLVRPDGWGVPDHYTTPHDLAVFTMYALNYPRFVRAISSRTYETESGGYYLTNNNRLLNSYDALVGGKTGYDMDSGWCLIEVATRGDDTMISVTFDGIHPDDWYDDNRVLLEYAFAQKARQEASGPRADAVFVGFKDPDAAVIARSATFGASLGLGAAAAANPGEAAAPQSAPAGSPVLAPAERAGERQLQAALGVALVLIVGGALGAFLGPRPKRLTVAAIGASAARSPVPAPPSGSD